MQVVEFKVTLLVGTMLAQFNQSQDADAILVPQSSQFGERKSDNLFPLWDRRRRMGQIRLLNLRARWRPQQQVVEGARCQNDPNLVPDHLHNRKAAFKKQVVGLVG